MQTTSIDAYLRLLPVKIQVTHNNDVLACRRVHLFNRLMENTTPWKMVLPFLSMKKYYIAHDDKMSAHDVTRWDAVTQHTRG